MSRRQEGTDGQAPITQVTELACRFTPCSLDAQVETGCAEPGSTRILVAIRDEGSNTMRFMVLLKADADTEGGVMPSNELLAEMGQYNEEMVKAGVLLAGEGLHPSSKGKRVKFSGKDRSVIDGPFAEAKELIAGYWLIQVKSIDEAIEWVKRCPNPLEGESEIEIRQVFEAEDFGDEFTPELREQEDRIRAQAEANQ